MLEFRVWAEYVTHPNPRAFISELGVDGNNGQGPYLDPNTDGVSGIGSLYRYACDDVPDPPRLVTISVLPLAPNERAQSVTALDKALLRARHRWLRRYMYLPDVLQELLGRRDHIPAYELAGTIDEHGRLRGDTMLTIQEGSLSGTCLALPRQTGGRHVRKAVLRRLLLDELSG